MVLAIRRFLFHNNGVAADSYTEDQCVAMRKELNDIGAGLPISTSDKVVATTYRNLMQEEEDEGYCYPSSRDYEG
jgi:hypothetical protein